METEEQVDLKQQPKKVIKNKRKTTPTFDFDIPNEYLYTLIGIIVIIIIIINYCYFSAKRAKAIAEIEKAKYMRGIEDTLLFDYNTLLRNKVELEEYCNYSNPKALEKEEYEKQITLANVSLLSNVFQMYVYRNEDFVSKEILTMESWESDETNNLLTSLLYFSSLNNLKPHEIYFLDIGSGIGWYSYFIAKYGYNVMSFEPSDLNNYILRKTFCLNKELNITFIKKGVYNIDKICDLYTNKKNRGDGFVFCDSKTKIPSYLTKKEEVSIIKLENYIPYLAKNNLGLIRIDVDGAEGKVIEGSIRLMSEYHVPFIYLKFNPEALKLHGTDPITFLNIFNKYGYLFPSYNFFDEVYLSPDEVIKKTNGTYNLYIVHHTINKKYNPPTQL